MVFCRKGVVCRALICLCLLFHLSFIAGQTNYCSSSLCNGRRHIGCNNNGSFSSKCASDARIMVLTANQRANILKKHNNLRNQVAGGQFSRYKPARRMAAIQWAPELARLAELNVKQCVMSHDRCRATSKFNYAGQNLAMYTFSGITKSVNELNMWMIQLWFDEHKDCAMKYIKSYSNHDQGKAIGHFTLMMAEKSTHIGCAVLRHTVNGRITQFLGCNYAYTNVYGQPIYRRGKTASACKTGRHNTYRNLCSFKEKYAVNNLKKY